MSLFSFFSKRSSTSREEGLRLRSELLKKLDGIDAMAKRAEHMKTELPGSVVYELCYGVICAIKADKRLFKERGEEAIKKMQEAVHHVNYVLSNMSRIVSPEQDLVEFEKDIRNGKSPMGPGPVTNYNWAINISNTNISNTYTSTVVISKRDGIWDNIKRAIIATIAAGIINKIAEVFRNLLLG